MVDSGLRIRMWFVVSVDMIAMSHLVVMLA